MKRIILIMMSLMMAFAAGCGTREKTPEYNYDVPEKNKADAMIDVAALQAAPVNVEKIVEDDGVEGYLAEVAPYSDTRMTKNFFWVGKPSGEKPAGGWPAVLLIHGGGGNAFADWVQFWTDAGYVALSIDVSGQMFDAAGTLVKNPEFYCDGSWGSVSCGTDEASFKKSRTYMNIAGCIRAHNYLRSLPYVNADKTVATGISWGGFLTCILSGLDKRFQAFAPVYGSGNRDTDSWGLSVGGLSALNESARAAWRQVYDPTAYLPYATRPMLFVSGMDDHAFSPVSHKASTCLVPGKVFFAYHSSLAHGHYWNITPCVGKFFDHILNKTKPAVNFLSATYADGTFTVEAEDACEASLVYTRSTEKDSHEWQWKSKNIMLKKGTNTFTVDGDVTAVFIAGYADAKSLYPDASTIFS